MNKQLKKIALVATPLAALLAGCGGGGSALDHVNGSNHYAKTILIANKAEYKPQIVNPDLQDGWGISLRPAGAGGHWWITANKTGKSLEYIGDTPGNPLHQDSLKEVTIPGPGGDMGTPTGTVFNVSGTGFVIDQPFPGGAALHGPAKFFFATDSGVVTAWTERAHTADSGIDRPTSSVIVWDKSAQGSGYFGMAISPHFDRLYLADFGEHPQVTVLNDQFQDISAGKFPNPFPGYAPFNVQAVGNSIFVAYAQQSEPAVELHGIGKGKLAEFTLDGALIATWDDQNLLNAPWGIVKAPDSGFGLYSGKLLVSNFGNGVVTVFDPATRKAIDYLRGDDKNPIVVDGIWDLKFGNGVAQGESNALYFAAGPNGEADGLFGKIKAQ
ncbi:MAG: hypothetical protein JWQ02_2946 [Capsulimonas sp.]|jgi:uncharacterized protein (TIGR03118 family)|nr:hypothetical protein [Capsulimonas sp.]